MACLLEVVAWRSEKLSVTRRLLSFLGRSGVGNTQHKFCNGVKLSQTLLGQNEDCNGYDIRFF